MVEEGSDAGALRADRPVAPSEMREVMGSFGSGVVVVTAACGAEPVGFTCQSFASLSLNPPLVSLSPARSSRTWPRIRQVGAFCVNVLAADQAEISQAFAVSRSDKFCGIAWSPGAFGAPVIDGVVAWIECLLWAEHDGGDHTVVLGKVHDLAARDDRDPLLYLRGSYVRRGCIAGA